jgi:hypothetical protein
MTPIQQRQAEYMVVFWRIYVITPTSFIVLIPRRWHPDTHKAKVTVPSVSQGFWMPFSLHIEKDRLSDT